MEWDSYLLLQTSWAFQHNWVYRYNVLPVLRGRFDSNAHVTGYEHKIGYNSTCIGDASRILLTWGFRGRPV